MRERDYKEFSAISFTTDRQQLADAMAERYGERNDVMVGCLDDYTPVCVGAAVMARPNVVTLLFFATEQFGEIALPVTRFIRKQFLPRLVHTGVHRIEAVSLAGYVETHAWLKTLGLDQETGDLRGYGKHGEVFRQFAWSRDDRPFGA
jgi:hypothetical protein